MSQYADLDADFAPLWQTCRHATMTSVERLYALYKAVEYLATTGVAGDIVECGVWRGGSMMCAALTLLRLGDTSRRLYLYDTFEGMTPPEAADVDFRGLPAETRLAAETRNEESAIWAYAPLERVRRNLASTGYPQAQINYVPGPVEKTIPGTVPERIALLRLDTDWYASTAHELRHLYPRLVKGGVLIVDDYGHWEGARRAVDEYFRGSEAKLLLNRIDYTGRIGVRV